MLQKTLSLGLLICTLSLAGCYTVPETGRSAFNLMPESMLTQQANAAFSELKSQTKVSTDAAQNARLKQVATRVLHAVGPEGNLPPPEQWEFVVFDDDKTINAFAMPGGKVGVYTGILNLASTDDELAVIIGHEIAHVAARHGNERVTQALSLAAIGVGVGYAVKDKDKNTQQAVMIAYGLGSQLGILLPYSRTHESEADAIGLRYSSRAGYDPRAGVTFWEKMAAQSGGKEPPEFLSTHPTSATRIRQIQAMLPNLMPEYERARGR